ncbi:MAG: hypothetical protein P8M53_09725 [Pirellulales bacterium]|nr:hypothetical protein [Pirellulales bacterium]
MGAASGSVLNLDKTNAISGFGTIDVNTHPGVTGLINGDPAESITISSALTRFGTVHGTTLGGNITDFTCASHSSQTTLGIIFMNHDSR